ncbi:uncharacterized protein PG998_000259 [Apiospora kogelbergensis]|uniref:uncharacterized protein n=1 Tax=Apiospora kogelbergensis TaxID=1337665 RepID=UPI00313033C8
MMNSGGDQLRIWLRNNSELLDWDKALELLDEVLDETDADNQGADCIDAWMNWAVPRFTEDQIGYGFHTARQYGLGDVYQVAWNDTNMALDEVEADLLAKTELVDRQMMQQVGDSSGGGEDHHHGGGDEEEAQEDSDSGVDSVIELTQEEDQVIQGMNA